MLSRTIGIDWDVLEAMRSHPEFKTEMLPHISEFITKMDRLQTARLQRSDNSLQLIEKLV